VAAVVAVPAQLAGMRPTTAKHWEPAPKAETVAMVLLSFDI